MQGRKRSEKAINALEYFRDKMIELRQKEDFIAYEIGIINPEMLSDAVPVAWTFGKLF